MGVLAPLYALAALAVVGPIVFHLIRRQPTGEMPFSSLMFLSPSPPRLTRRSRLDNWLLLLLRVLALLLIGLAFMRPYLRQESLLNSTLSGRRIVAVLDTSGSMQRNDVWRSAQQEWTRLVDSLSDTDQIALYTIDQTLTPIVSIDSPEYASPDASQQAVRQAMQTIKPTWHTTELAEGLKSAADLLAAAAITGKVDSSAESEIVLITDLHTETKLESLQGFLWPEKIALDVRQVRPASVGNARPSLMKSSDESSDSRLAKQSSGYRLRIENNADSEQQDFQIAWQDRSGAVLGSPTTVQVPAGQVRVVPMVSRPSQADRIVLSGDGWDADNTVFVAEPIVATERIAFLSQSATDGGAAKAAEDNLLYFLNKAPLGTDLVRREIIPIETAGLSAVLGEAETKAAVVELPLAMAGNGSGNTAENPGFAVELRRFAERGGTVIACLATSIEETASVEEFLSQLLDVGEMRVDEAAVKDFALLSEIDFHHPVFASFADPRFNDFGKIRFWSHREIGWPESDSSGDAAAAAESALVDSTQAKSTGKVDAFESVDPEGSSLNVVARFDDGAPMLVEQVLGKGRVWLLTSGWQPRSSGLGLSSKFVPILMGMLDPTGRSRGADLTYEAGEPIDTQAFGSVVVSEAGGEKLDPSLFDQTQRELTIRKPGLYLLDGENGRRQVAVQVPASESRLLPLDKDVFEEFGIALGKVESADQLRSAIRQRQIEELEREQKLWKWLIVLVCVVLALEIFSAGWLARKGLRAAEVDS